MASPSRPVAINNANFTIPDDYRRPSRDGLALSGGGEHADFALRLGDRSRPKQCRRASIGNGEIHKLAEKSAAYKTEDGKSDAEILSCLNSIYSGITSHDAGPVIPASRASRIEGLPDLMSKSHRSSFSSNTTSTSPSDRSQLRLFKRKTSGRSLTDSSQRMRSRRASIGNGEISKLARSIVPEHVDLYNAGSDDERSDFSESSVSRIPSSNLNEASSHQKTRERSSVSRQSSGNDLKPKRTISSAAPVEATPSPSETLPTRPGAASQQSKSWYKQIQTFYKKATKDR